MKSLNDVFNQYDSPERARRVWEEYKSDLNAHNTPDALIILRECTSADSLDVGLDVLLNKPVHIVGNSHSSLSSSDEESLGGSSNARRNLEDG